MTEAFPRAEDVHAAEGAVPTGGAITRRDLLKTGGIGLAGLAAAPSLARLGLSPGRPARSAAPLQVGALVTTSGPFAVYGSAMVNGFQLYLDQHGGKLGSRPVKVSINNTQGDPTTALQLAQKLISSGVDFAYGTVTDPEALAIAPEFNGAKIPLVITGANSVELSTTKRGPFVYRTTCTFYQNGYQPSRWFYEHLGSRDVWVMTWDFTGGDEIAAAIAKGFASKGGKLAGVVKTPFPVTGNFQPYFSRLHAAGAKGVMAFYGGTDAVSFLKQWGQFGLAKQAKLLGITALTDHATIPGTGNTVIGTYGSQFYVPAVSNAVNKTFVADYRRRFHAEPNFYAVAAYAGAQYLDAVLATLGGSTSNKTALQHALAKPYHLATPAGTWTMNPKYNSPDLDLYVWRDVAAGKGSAEKVLASFPSPPVG